MADNSDMATQTQSPATHELQTIMNMLARGVRDPELARKARERMDRQREELRQQIGTVEVALDLIRDARDQ